MCFRKKINEEEIFIEDRKILLLAAQEIDVIEKLTNNVEIKEKLIEIKELIRYSSPYAKISILEIDRKIKNKLDDLKLSLLNKNDAEEYVLEKIMDIEVFVRDRNSKEIK